MNTIGVRRFRGLETLPEKGKINLENCRDIQDVNLVKGMLSSRRGYQKFNTTAFSSAINGLYGYKNRWGNFTVDAYGDTVSAQKILTPNFVATPQIGDINLTVYFMDTTPDWDDEIEWWLWDFGDGNNSTEQHPSHTYTVPGVYSVRLLIGTGEASFNCYKAGFINVTGLTPDFLGVPLFGDKPLTVAFFDITFAPSYLITGWAWDFGDDGTSTEQNPTHTYITEGQYEVSLTITTSGASFTRTVSDYITVTVPVDDPEYDPTPISDFIATPVKGEKNLIVDFTDLTVNEPDGATYLWDFGDGKVGTEQHPRHTYKQVGLFDVTLTINGTYVCLKEYYILVTQPVNPLPTDPIPPDITKPSFTWLWAIGSKYRLFFKNKENSASPAGQPYDKYIGWNEGTVAGRVEVKDNSVGPGDGKVFLGRSIEDTHIYSDYPDWHVNEEWIQISVSSPWLGGDDVRRVLIKCSPNKILHLLPDVLYSGLFPVDVIEVNPDDFNMDTVTWNTRPALGDLIYTWTSFNVPDWEEIPTGTTGAICLKFSDETGGENKDYEWYSTEEPDADKRPYITDP